MLADTVSNEGRIPSAPNFLDHISTQVNGNMVTWSMQWRTAPDFSIRDEFGRQGESFQLFLGNTPTISYETTQSIVRGEGLLLRNVVPDPGTLESDRIKAGGWGSILEVVPITQVDNLVTYQTSLDGLNFGLAFGITSVDLEPYRWPRLPRVLRRVCERDRLPGDDYEGATP